MKQSLLLPLLLFTGIVLNAQSTPPWLWAKGYGSYYETAINNVHTTTNGDIYASGYYWDDGDDVATYFVSKMDSAGNPIWSQSLTATILFPNDNLAVDGEGNVYISGNFMGPFLAFGQDTFTTNNIATNLFVAKFDPSGNFKWVKCPAINKSGADIVGGISGDASGNLWVVGGFGDSITFGSTTLISSGPENVFVVKYDSAGNVLLAQQFGGESSDAAYGVTTDTAGNAYITGSYSSEAINIDGIVLDNMGDQNIFSFKCSSSGRLTWVKSAGGNGRDAGQGICVDNKGNAYVTGYLSSTTATFGTFGLQDTNNYGQGFVVKYDPYGNALWLNGQTANNGNANGASVSSDANGNVYVAGYFGGQYMIIGTNTLVNADTTGQTPDIFLVKYDSSGNTTWALRQGGTLSDQPGGISNDAKGNIYVSGNWNSASMVFGDTTLENPMTYIGEYTLGFIAELATNACTYSLPFDTLFAADTGGTYKFVIGTQQACGWLAQVSPGINWFQLSRFSGYGPDSVSIIVASNNADTTRTGTITINGMTITVIQPGNPASCYYQLSAYTFSCPSAAANTYYYISNVTTQTGCTWDAVVLTGNDWLSSSSAGSGDGNITITVMANTSGTPRTGTIFIGNETLTVAQPGDSSACTYILSGNTFFCSSAAATSYNQIITVTTADTCSWTAIVTSGSDWLSTSSAYNGSGAIYITVQQNLTDSSRSGTIEVEGQTITVYQPDGADNCIYNLSLSTYVCPLPDSATYTNICQVTTSESCTWAANVTAGNDWLSTTSADTGNGYISFAATQNNTGATRNATIEVNEHNLSITQLAYPEGIAAVSPPGVEVYPNPSTGQFYFKGVAPGSTLKVYDALGQNIYSIMVNGNTCLLDISSHAKGVYFYRVTNNGNAVQNGKIVME